MVFTPKQIAKSSLLSKQPGELFKAQGEQVPEHVAHAFRKYMDFFDMNSDEYLLTYHLLTGFYLVREHIALKLNANPESIPI